MTEATIGQATCRMGSKTDKPCPFPAVHWDDSKDDSGLCRLHAAKLPLYDETTALANEVELLDKFIKRAGKDYAAELVEVLKTLREERGRTLALLDKALEDIMLAERHDIRG